MSDKPSEKVPLILNQEGGKIKGVQPLPYEFGAETYGVYRNRKNPFLGRTIAPPHAESELNAEKASQLFRKLEAEGAYGLGVVSTDSPHRKRKVASTALGQPPRKPGKFPASSQLPGNPQRLSTRVQGFFQHTLRRLRESPEALPLIVNELVPLLQEQRIRVRIPEIFRQFYGFDPFLETLERIAEDAEVENFELFCAAIFGFYSQHG